MTAAEATLGSAGQILDQLTLEEKASLLAGVDFWHVRGLERFGIPAMFVADCGHGVTLCGERSSPATCFPTGIGLASTWNPALLEEAGAVIGRECLALGVSILLGPKINLHRLPLNGRSFETFSEDPLLAGRLGAAMIRGIQAQGVGSCVKAMAANNQQRDQEKVSAEVDERTLREIYLRNFEIAVDEGGPCAIMTSYNRLNGDYAAENGWLIQGIIKDEWQFPGLVVSDWRSIFTKKVYASGLDLEMPGPGKFFPTANILEALRDGLLSEAGLDDKASRIVRVALQFARDENAAGEFAGLLDAPENRAIALRAAEESIVLLKNDGNLLPLDRKTIRRVAVIGPNAAEARLGGGGSASVTPFHTIGPLEGIREFASEVVFAEGCSLVGTMTPVAGVFEHRSEDGSWQPGLLAEFFNQDNGTNRPDATWAVDRIDYSWGWAAPGPGVARGDYRAAFSGRLVPRKNGLHRFGFFGQEGVVRIDFGSEKIAGAPPDENNFEAKYGSQYLTFECDLTAGEPVDIRFEYEKRAARAAVRMEWEEPGEPSPMEHAAAVAKTADVAIVCAGLSNLFEGGSRDRETLDLPAAQIDLIRKIAAANPKTIVVLNNGGPVVMPWADEVPALVETWYPGQEGGRALARILFGETSPSGRLPDTIPFRLEDHAAAANYPGDGEVVRYEEGIFIGYRHFDTANVTPHFPFGFGLSYTEFEYSDVTLSSPAMSQGGQITARVTVTNTGERAGKETVQLYVRDQQASVPRPDKELRNFQKIDLEPGETKTVELAVTWRDLAFWDTKSHAWRVEPGEFEILVGPHSRELKPGSLTVN